MSNTASPLPIGQWLLKEGIIEQQDLDKALIEQRRSGARIGDVLAGLGKVRYHRLYQELAKKSGMAFVDLSKQPCDELLLEESERDVYHALQALPWKRDGKYIVIATSDVNDELDKWASAKFLHYRFVITSPYDIAWSIQAFFGEHDDERARMSLWKEVPKQSARFLFMENYMRVAALLLSILIASCLWFEGGVYHVLLCVNIFFLVTVFAKLVFFVAGIKEKKVEHPFDMSVAGNDKDLPIYSILVPMYKEKKQTIQQLLQSLSALDYPKSKLDVKLVVEADDEETILIIKSLKPEPYFHLIEVPPSNPRTKPKACNYALNFCKGEVVTIYDAEDKPDPFQLKKVMHAFRNDDESLVCVQAKLNYYNYNENVLTRMFALEYALWFNFLLVGLERLGIPIPLGGTSNHFKIDVLKKLHAWDPYNVTEDADLGIRLTQHGYKTTVIDSTTLEEAPVSIWSWIKQRSRWIKGYMQTYIVHMREPKHFCKQMKFRGFVGFLFFVGAPTMVYFTKPFVIVFSIILLVSDPALPEWLLWLSVISLGSSLVLHFLIAVFMTLKFRWWPMAIYCLLFPFYWVLHGLASMKSFWELFTKPHYWEKTEHGVSKHKHSVPAI